jgi:hypothetical protein
MISTKKFKPESRSADQSPGPTDAVMGGCQQPIATAAVMGGIGVLSMATRRLVSSNKKVVDTPLNDAHALAIFKQKPEANDRFTASLQANLWHGKTLTDSQMVWVHASAIDLLEKKYVIEGNVHSVLTSIFLILRDIRQGCSTPVVHLINSDDQQTIKIFHRTELVKRNPYPGVVQVFCNDNWCGQIKQLNPRSSVSTCFCRTSFCPEWVEKLLLCFADHPSFAMNEYRKLTGKNSVH